MVSSTMNHYISIVQKLIFEDADTSDVCPFILYCVLFNSRFHILAIFVFAANSAKLKYAPNIVF